MRTGTALSVMLHGALVALALVSWPKEPLEPPQEFNTVDVEMVTISDETNVMAAEDPAPPTPAPAPAPAPPPPAVEPDEAAPPPPPRAPEPPRERQAALPPKPEPRPQARSKPEPKPEPKRPEPKRPEPKRPEPKQPEAKPVEAKKPEPKKPEPPKPEPKKPEPVREAKKPEPKKPEPKKPEPPKQEAKKPEAKQPEKKPEKPDKPAQTADANAKKPDKKTEKPKPKKDEFNLDAIGAAADKLAQTQPEKPSEAPAKPQASGPRSAAGRGTKMTSTEIDALRSTISQCWNIPAGAPNPETLVVRLKLFLNQDGTVARRPELVDTAGRAASDPYFRAAAEAAMRAVQVCAPYQLPAEKYDDWSEITINFRPPF